MIWNQKFRNLKFNYQKIILFLFILIGSFGVNHNGGDLMWYPSGLLADGVDMYSNYIFNHTNWFMTSVPNYPPLFYQILLPFSSLSFVAFKLFWFILVVFCLTYSSFSFITSLKSEKTAWIFTFVFVINIFLISSIRVGQITPFILSTGLLMLMGNNRFFLLIPWSLKFTFGIPLFLVFLQKKNKFKGLLIIGVLHLISLIIFSFQTNKSLLNGLGFLKVGEFSKFTLGTASGNYDLMSLLINYDFQNIFSIYKILIIFIVLLMGYYLKNTSNITQIRIAILISLVFFFHLSYDYSLFLLVIISRISKINWIFKFHLLVYILLISIELLTKFHYAIPLEINFILFTLIFTSLIIELLNVKSIYLKY